MHSHRAVAARRSSAVARLSSLVQAPAAQDPISILPKTPISSSFSFGRISALLRMAFLLSPTKDKTKTAQAMNSKRADFNQNNIEVNSIVVVSDLEWDIFQPTEHINKRPSRLLRNGNRLNMPMLRAHRTNVREKSIRSKTLPRP